ncbi:MAG: DUF1343 domain-containing protein [Clostridia bacterium]|nr:DUF1343 domain-containing protein [Clostridia bacterium]
MRKVLSGVDRTDLMDQAFKGKRLAVVTGGGAVDRNLISTLDILTSRYQVVRLFNTIYGVRGDFRYGEEIPYYVDEKTGLDVHSIFNIERTAPTQEMMQDVDMLVFDIRGAGTRFFEYLHCLASIMKACARYQKPVAVLDRIAPLGGEIVEGTVCPPDMHTIVGDYELPSRFAMTMGEFARYINGEFGIGCDLTVIPVEGWSRRLYYDETDVPWLLPSPSLNGVTANLLYAGFCVFEGVSTISEGRGTSKPFELIGAPWLNTPALIDGLKARGLEGVRFAPVYFRPQASKHNGDVCSGVQILVDDRQSFRPFLTALSMLEIIRDLHPQEIKYRDCSAGHCVKEEASSPTFTRYIDKLLATDAFSEGRLSAQQLNDAYAPARRQFIQKKEKYHLYE